MTSLGHERFAVVGHDRGGRVAYRTALDHPERVDRLCTLDIVPTIEQFELLAVEPAGRRRSASTGTSSPSPPPLPEALIGAEPRCTSSRSWAAGPARCPGREAHHRRGDGRLRGVVHAGGDRCVVRRLPGRARRSTATSTRPTAPPAARSPAPSTPCGATAAAPTVNEAFLATWRRWVGARPAGDRQPAPVRPLHPRGAPVRLHLRALHVPG